MVGGDKDAFDRAKPLLDCYTKMQRSLGPPAAGQLAKMVNQIFIAGVVQGLAETLHSAQATGQDGEVVLDVMSKGAAQPWQMENRGNTMLKGEIDFDLLSTGCAKNYQLC